MRFRRFWVGIPALAAGISTPVWHSSAAEPPATFGYYPPKVQPAPPGLVPGSEKYIRPNAAPVSPAGSGPQQSAKANPPTSTPPASWSNVKPRITGPAGSGAVASGPALAGPVLPVGNAEPVSVRPVGKPVDQSVKFFPDAKPVTIPEIKLPVLDAAPPPDEAVKPAGITIPSPIEAPLPSPVVGGSGGKSPTLSPPKLTVETSDEPKPLPLTSPPPAGEGPLPVIPGLPANEMPAKPAQPAAPVVITPASTSVSAGPAVGPRNTPMVVLEALAPESIAVGQPLSYELVVRNTGNSTVGNVRVEEDPPSGVKFLSSDPPAEQVGAKYVWSLGGMDGGSEKRIKITVKPADEGEVRSRATVSFSAAAETRIKVTRPKLGVTVTAAEAVRVGEEVSFAIRLANTGSGTATKLALQANLSDGLHHPQGGVVEAALESLPPGESRVINLRATASKAGPQTCNLVVVAEGTGEETSKAVVNVVEPLLNARVSGPARCLVRGEPEFKFELTNPGTATTDPLGVTASIPDGFEFISASDAASFQPGTKSVVWRLAGVPAGGRKEVTVKVRANSPNEGVVKMMAQTVSDTGEMKPGRGLEAKAETVVKAEGVAALRFDVMDLDDPIEVGKDAIYEIKVVNQGTAVCTNVQVVATLADGCTATGATGPSPARGQGQQVTFDALPQLATKQEVVFRIKVKGSIAGDQRFRVQVACDQVKSPVVKEESTRFVKD